MFFCCNAVRKARGDVTGVGGDVKPCVIIQRRASPGPATLSVPLALGHPGSGRGRFSDSESRPSLVSLALDRGPAVAVQQPRVKPAPVPAPAPAEPSKPKEPQVIDFAKIQDQTDLDMGTMTVKRKDRFGLKNSVDMVVRPGESFRVGSETVQVQVVLDKIQALSHNEPRENRPGVDARRAYGRLG